MRVLLLALLVILAGCSQPPDHRPTVVEPTEDLDRADEDELEVEEADLDRGGREDGEDAEPGPGALRILVRDASDRPIPDAAVLLAGQDRFADTDADGTAEFPELEPGRHQLRIQREYFRVLEINVTVAPDVLKTVTVQLQLQEGLLTPPHHHDNWQGRDEVLLFDVQWDVTCVGSFGGLFGVCEEDGDVSDQGDRDFAFPEGATIWPGTGALRLTVTWDGTRDDVGVTLDTPAGDPERVVTSGEPASFAITPEMWDPPHAGTSFSYLAFSPNAVSYHGLYESPVQVSVTLVRGDEPLPFDPPHPDRWEGATQKRIDDRTFSFGFVRWGTLEYAVPGAEGHERNGHTFPEGRTVIPGTTEVVWRVWLNQTVASNDLVLEFTPEVDKQFGPDVWIRRAPDVDRDEFKEWRVPVRDAWADDIYHTTSTWAWKLAPAPVTDADTFHTMAWVADAHVIIDIHR